MKKLDYKGLEETGGRLEEGSRQERLMGSSSTVMDPGPGVGRNIPVLKKYRPLDCGMTTP